MNENQPDPPEEPTEEELWAEFEELNPAKKSQNLQRTAKRIMMRPLMRPLLTRSPPVRMKRPISGLMRRQT